MRPAAAVDAIRDASPARSMPTSDIASPDPVLSASLTEPQQIIAVALVEAGAVDEAVKIADGLDDK